MKFTVISICIGIAIMVMFFWFRVARRKREKEALLQGHSEESWLQNREWSEGKIHCSTMNFRAIFFALGVSTFFSLVVLWIFLNRPDGIFSTVIATLLLVGFWSFEVALLFITGYMLLRWSKYGRSVLEMASVPGVIGGQFAGVVRTSKKIKTEDVFRVRLICIHGTVGENGTNSIIWESEQLIARDLPQHDGGGSAIPFLFQIPYECRPTDKSDLYDYIKWKLEVTSKTSGVTYRSEFEVPIFKTDQSDPGFVVDESLIEAYKAPGNPQQDLQEAGVRRTISPNGEDRFIFPMARQFGYAIIWSLALAIFGVPVFFFYEGFDVGTVFGSVLCVLFGIAILYISLDLWFYRSVVDVSPRGLSVKAGLFGGMTRRWIERSEIKEMRLDSHMNSDQKKYYDIIAIRSNGKKVTLAKRLPGQRLASSVQQQIEEILLDKADMS